MTKHERWFSSVTLLIGVLPSIIVALVQSFIESPVFFVETATGGVLEFSVSQINYVGIFGLIPFAFVFLARLLRGRGLLERHFTVVIAAVLVMSVVFFVIISWIVVSTLIHVDLTGMIARIDYMALVCSMVSIVFCMLSNCLPDLPPNPFFGVKNVYTVAHPAVWTKVNGAAASALTYIFLLAAVVTAYLSGIYSILALLAAIFIYYIWVIIFSRYVYKHLPDPDSADALPAPENRPAPRE